MLLCPALSLVVIVEINELTINLRICPGIQLLTTDSLELLRLVFKILYYLIVAYLLLILLLDSSALVNFLNPMFHKLNLHVYRWSYTHPIAYANSFSNWPLIFHLSFRSENSNSFMNQSARQTSPSFFWPTFPSMTKWNISWVWLAHSFWFLFAFFSVFKFFKVYNKLRGAQFQTDTDKIYYFA